MVDSEILNNNSNKTSRKVVTIIAPHQDGSPFYPLLQIPSYLSHAYLLYSLLNRCLPIQTLQLRVHEAPASLALPRIKGGDMKRGEGSTEGDCFPERSRITNVAFVTDHTHIEHGMPRVLRRADGWCCPPAAADRDVQQRIAVPPHNGHRTPSHQCSYKHVTLSAHPTSAFRLKPPHFYLQIKATPPLPSG